MFVGERSPVRQRSPCCQCIACPGRHLTARAFRFGQPRGTRQPQPAPRLASWRSEACGTTHPLYQYLHSLREVRYLTVRYNPKLGWPCSQHWRQGTRRQRRRRIASPPSPQADRDESCSLRLGKKRPVPALPPALVALDRNPVFWVCHTLYTHHTVQPASRAQQSPRGTVNSNCVLVPLGRKHHFWPQPNHFPQTRLPTRQNPQHRYQWRDAR